jgi:hypothetical protein
MAALAFDFQWVDLTRLHAVDMIGSQAMLHQIDDLPLLSFFASSGSYTKSCRRVGAGGKRTLVMIDEASSIGKMICIYILAAAVSELVSFRAKRTLDQGAVKELERLAAGAGVIAYGNEHALQCLWPRTCVMGLPDEHDHAVAASGNLGKSAMTFIVNAIWRTLKDCRPARFTSVFEHPDPVFSAQIAGRVLDMRAYQAGVSKISA